MITAPSTKDSSILRVLRILETAATAERPMSATDIHMALGVPKPTVHRMCQTLIEEGFLSQEMGGKRLLPGPRLARLALAALHATSFAAERRLILEQVSREIGETSNIAVPDGHSMLYLDRVETHWPLRVQLPVGSHVPLHCTASGKLYLASLPAERRRRLLAQLPLERHTANTITDARRLAAELERIAAERLGSDNEEFVEAMVALAVPVTDGKGTLCATLSFHAPTQRVSFDQAHRYEPVLREGAQKLSRAMLAASAP